MNTLVTHDGNYWEIKIYAAIFSWKNYLVEIDGIENV